MWKNISSDEKKAEIEEFMRTRLNAYVGAENKFWDKNGTNSQNNKRVRNI